MECMESMCLLLQFVFSKGVVCLVLQFVFSKGVGCLMLICLVSMWCVLF